MSSDSDGRKPRDVSNLTTGPTIKVDKSPQVPVQKSEKLNKDKLMQFRHSESFSDSDGSDESISGEGSTYTEPTPTQPASTSTATSSGRKTRQKKLRKTQRRDWEVIEGLREGQRCEEKPEKHDGYLMKKRKWPMKGWHKRFFVLDKGILTYAKSPNDIQKGKYHGVIDIGLSVLAFKQQRQRLYIDAEDSVYHIKLKETSKFSDWLKKLKHHRLYRQHEISYGTKESPRLTDVTSPTEDLMPLSPHINFPEKARSGSLKRAAILRQSSIKGSPLIGQNKVATWLLDTAGIEHCNKDLSDARRNLFELRDLLTQIQNIPIAIDVPCDYQPALSSPRRKKMGLSLRSKWKSRNDPTACNSTSSSPQHNHLKESPPSHNTLAPVSDRIHLSSSNPNLVEMNSDRPRPTSMPDYSTPPDHEIRINDFKIRENFLTKAEEVTEILKSLVRTIGTERDRLKQAFEHDSGPGLQNNSNTITSLRASLAEAQKQNAELVCRLSRINAESNLSGSIMSPIPSGQIQIEKDPPVNVLKQSFSAETVSVVDLYFDAEETLGSSDSSSEQSDEEVSSEISDDNDTDLTQAQTSVSEELLADPTAYQTGRRSTLPCPKPDVGDISLWSLLCKNIGKDLSKISMPVTLNEPLNMLQRLCEELEYSELLDKAAEHDDPYERMLYIAAFAVSAYASTYHRAGYKPFNPLLEETYENVREDKGWKFIGEQVSHHPPISACHCESRNFIFKQDVRIKNKFWGKSMEIQPIGTVSVALPRYNDHYTWNKVTTCVHNIFGGQRWVDQYGEMTIRNRDIVCKISFAKASYWSSKRHELVGQVLNPEGRVVHHLFGKWNEALYSGQSPSTRCIWRPGVMPDDFELYYGFSRYAIELNDPEREHASYMPPTDTRFRPDQRLLEEGRIEEAEKEKLRLEQVQRDRRKKREESNVNHDPRWFRKQKVGNEERYEFNGKYWELRKEPGFMKMTFTKLW